MLVDDFQGGSAPLVAWCKGINSAATRSRRACLTQAVASAVKPID